MVFSRRQNNQADLINTSPLIHFDAINGKNLFLKSWPYFLPTNADDNIRTDIMYVKFYSIFYNKTKDIFSVWLQTFTDLIFHLNSNYLYINWVRIKKPYVVAWKLLSVGFMHNSKSISINHESAFGSTEPKTVAIAVPQFLTFSVLTVSKQLLIKGLSHLDIAEIFSNVQSLLPFNSPATISDANRWSPS